jgi:hypothetical protein
MDIAMKTQRTSNCCTVLNDEIGKEGRNCSKSILQRWELKQEKIQSILKDGK